LERELDAALHKTLVWNDELEAKVNRLEAENAQLRTRLDAVMNGFSADGMLGVLRSIAFDTTLPAEVRTRAAAAGAPFERPKLQVSATANVPKLFDILEKKRLEELEKRQPKTILGNAPPLASDHGGDPLGPPEGDSAA
jgi:hypothetical protein